MKWIYVCLVVVVLINVGAPQLKPRPRPRPRPKPEIIEKKQIVYAPTPPPASICDVENQVRIQCGPPNIEESDCNAIDCCYVDGMCYYARSVTLQCTKDGQFILVVAKDATLPNIDTSTCSLLEDDAGCQPVAANSVFAIYQFPVTACGTQMTEQSGVMTYTNRMTSSYTVTEGPHGHITRDSTFELDVKCEYSSSASVAIIIEVGNLPPPTVQPGYGPLHVELRIANGRCSVKLEGCNEEEWAYTSFYTDADYPITKALRDAVYVDVRIVGRTDTDLTLTLGRCWVTNSPNPLSQPQWNLLTNGCPASGDPYTTKTLDVHAGVDAHFPTHHRHFVFKMFTFVDPTTRLQIQEKVFIHCETAVCLEDCEPKCGVSARPPRLGRSINNNTTNSSTFSTANTTEITAASRKTQQDRQQETFITSSGEVIFVHPDY